MRRENITLTPQMHTHDANRKESKPVPTSILGTQTLTQIGKDMERIQLPSWVPPGPPHPGETKWGKLHADQWRTFCTVHLPVTLARLWGDRPLKSREYKMLQNFLHLVTAVKLGTTRTTSRRRAKEYEYHMKKYLESLLILFPGIEMTPYQHMALHVGEQLHRFGPTHSWRCYAFERFNHVFQNIETNNIYGNGVYPS